MDGFAVRAADTFGASEAAPVRLALGDETIATGVAPVSEVAAGAALAIATGGMLPRGADAVVPVEDTDVEAGRVVVRRSVAPGAAVSFAGTDVGSGETVLFSGTRLSSRETGVLAAIGRDAVLVVRRPRVAILSTGDEIVQPGERLRPGLVYDSNGRILADAVTRARRRAGFHGRLPRRRGCAARGARARARERRRRAVLGRDLEGGRRSVRARGRRARSGDHRARRGAQARQAHLPRRCAGDAPS